jgi:hypothetical protein
MSEKKRLRDTDNDIIKIEALDGGGFKMECKNNYEGDVVEWGQTYYGLVSYEDLKNLDGKLLTLIDAVIADKEQRKSVKDILRRIFWFDWVDNHIYKGKDNMACGMPVVTKE